MHTGLANQASRLEARGCQPLPPPPTSGSLCAFFFLGARWSWTRSLPFLGLGHSPLPTSGLAREDTQHGEEGVEPCSLPKWESGESSQLFLSHS